MTATGTGLNASFVYDGDGKRVQSTINSVTTSFVGNYYEVSGSAVTKYYYAGTQRIAMRQGSTLYYLLGDHLGSTSITTSSTGTKVAELRYKAWGEVRYTSGTTPSKYQYTGQYSNVADFGLVYMNARWYDGSLGRWAQADSVVPGGVQGLDRYGYVNNNPVLYIDPSGHICASRANYRGPRSLRDEECLETPLLLTFQTEGDRQWTQSEKDVLLAGASDVASALARDLNELNQKVAEMEGDPYYETLSPAMAFHRTYGGAVNVVRKAGKCAEVIGDDFPGCEGWGYSNTKNEIWIFDNATPSVILNYPRLIVHELGHSFDKATSMSSYMPADTKNRNGFYGPPNSWQLSTDMADTEIFADMFVGWVYGRWETYPIGDLKAAAATKATFMSQITLYEIRAWGR